MPVVSKKDKKVSVLITAAGGAGTIEIIRSLREIGSYRIVATDASRHAGGFAFADSSYIVPMATSETFSYVAGDLIRKEHPQFVIPLVDEEILPFHNAIKESGGDKIRVVTPTTKFCTIALDKWHTFLALKDICVPTPHTCLASEARSCQFPMVIKPRHGRGSHELAYLKGQDDLIAYLSGSPRPADYYVVQEQIIGREYTVSVVVGLGGPTLAIVPKEVLNKRNITQVGVTRMVPEIEHICREIQDRLRADGPFNVQLIMTEDRKPYVIEINPRYSTTVALTIAAGINEVDVVIRQALGAPVGSLAFQPNLLMLRYSTQIYVMEDKWPPCGNFS
jgi:carbamoyl-phosphate synthase large subunit